MPVWQATGSPTTLKLLYKAPQLEFSGVWTVLMRVRVVPGYADEQLVREDLAELQREHLKALRGDLLPAVLDRDDQGAENREPL